MPVIGDLRLQPCEHALYFHRLGRRRRDDEALEREAIGCDALRQARIHQRDDGSILLDARQRVAALARSGIGDEAQALIEADGGRIVGGGSRGRRGRRCGGSRICRRLS